MSGRPAGATTESCTLVVAAVVINPPRSRVLPEPDLLWLRMGAGGNLSECTGGQKPAALSKFHCFIIKIGPVPIFGRQPCESIRAFAAVADRISAWRHFPLRW